MDENISDQFLNEINTTSNPAVVLTSLYCKLYDLTNFATYIKIFGKLVKVYSRKNIFFAILDTYDVDNFRPENPYALLTYFLKKRLEDKVNPINRIDIKQLEFQYNSARDDLKDIVMQDPFCDEDSHANEDI